MLDYKPTIQTPTDLIDVRTAAERLAVSSSAIYRLVSKQQVPFYRLPAGIRFRTEDVDTYLMRRRVEARPTHGYGRS